VKTKWRVVGLTLISLPVVATWALLALLGRSFVIATPGSSPEYWEYLCGVQLPPFRGHHPYSRSGGTLPEVENSLYYFAQLHHEEVLYSVPTDQVLGDAEAVRVVLFGEERDLPASCYEDGRDLCRVYWNASETREACRGVLQGQRTPISAAELRTFRGAVLSRSKRAQESEAEDRAFLERFRRGRRVWLTLAFEGLYVTAWWAFVAWKLLPLPRPVSWRWQVGVAPLLLFLPYFLGYAPMTFSFGPSGGFIYPAYLMVASLPLHFIPCTRADEVVWNSLPKILSPLSQLPGHPLAASFMVCVGPVSSLIAGVSVVALFSLAIFVTRGLRVRAVRKVNNAS